MKIRKQNYGNKYLKPLLIVISVASLLRNEEQPHKAKEDVTTPIKAEEIKKEPKTLCDFVFGKNLSLSIDLNEINVNPNFEEISNEKYDHIYLYAGKTYKNRKL